MDLSGFRWHIAQLLLIQKQTRRHLKTSAAEEKRQQHILPIKKTLSDLNLWVKIQDLSKFCPNSSHKNQAFDWSEENLAARHEPLIFFPPLHGHYIIRPKHTICVPGITMYTSTWRRAGAANFAHRLMNKQDPPIKISAKALRLHSLYLHSQPTEALHAPITLDEPLGMERVQTSRGITVQRHKGPVCYRKKVRTSRGGCKNKNKPFLLTYY